jgi:hypothetical protein
MMPKLKVCFGGDAVPTPVATRMPSMCLLLLRHQVPQRQIIHDVFDIFDPVLQTIATASQTVVLEVEDLEACMQVLDELIDQQRTLVIAEGDSITSETCLSHALVM